MLVNIPSCAPRPWNWPVADLSRLRTILKPRKVPEYCASTMFGTPDAPCSGVLFSMGASMQGGGMLCGGDEDYSELSVERY